MVVPVDIAVTGLVAHVALVVVSVAHNGLELIGLARLEDLPPWHANLFLVKQRPVDLDATQLHVAVGYIADLLVIVVLPLVVVKVLHLVIDAGADGDRAVPVSGSVEASGILGEETGDGGVRRVPVRIITRVLAVEVVVVIDNPGDIGYLLRLWSDVEHLVKPALVGLVDHGATGDGAVGGGVPGHDGASKVNALILLVGPILMGVGEHVGVVKAVRHIDVGLISHRIALGDVHDVSRRVDSVGHEQFERAGRNDAALELFQIGTFVFSNRQGAAAIVVGRDDELDPVALVIGRLLLHHL